MRLFNIFNFQNKDDAIFNRTVYFKEELFVDNIKKLVKKSDPNLLFEYIKPYEESELLYSVLTVPGASALLSKKLEQYKIIDILKETPPDDRLYLALENLSDISRYSQYWRPARSFSLGYIPNGFTQIKLETLPILSLINRLKENARLKMLNKKSKNLLRSHFVISKKDDYGNSPYRYSSDRAEFYVKLRKAYLDTIIGCNSLHADLSKEKVEAVKLMVNNNKLLTTKDTNWKKSRQFLLNNYRMIEHINEIIDDFSENEKLDLLKFLIKKVGQYEKYKPKESNSVLLSLKQKLAQTNLENNRDDLFYVEP